MKIRNLKTKVIGPVLLLIPMMCMHMGDGHHSGDHHSSVPQQLHQSFTHPQPTEEKTGGPGMIGGEGIISLPDGEKGK